MNNIKLNYSNHFPTKQKPQKYKSNIEILIFSMQTANLIPNI